MIHERSHCRTCGSKNLTLILDLGKTALANDFLTPEEAPSYKISLPLRVVLCRDCSLVQLADTVDPKVLYSRYAYITSTSKTMDAHLSEQAAHLLQTGNLGKGAKVLEIASNTGVFLKKFKERGCEVLGVEPAANIASVARERGIRTEVCFHGRDTAARIAAQYGKADLVAGNNVLAHVPDINDFVGGMKILLKPGGVITMEFPHLMRLIDENQWDTIYHEHFSYFSLIAVEKIFAAHGLTLFDVDELPTHGGSLRIYARHAENSSRPISQRCRPSGGHTCLISRPGRRQKSPASKPKGQFLLGSRSPRTAG